MDSAVTARWLAASATVPMPVIKAVMTIWARLMMERSKAAGRPSYQAASRHWLQFRPCRR